MKKETKSIIEELRNVKKEQTEKSSDSLISHIDLDKEIEYMNIKIIGEAENQKLELRDELVIAVKHIIWFQLVFFNIIILVIVLSVTVRIPFFRNFEKELSIQLFEFLKYYIGATIVELLGMLVFILHYVFSDFKLSKGLIKNQKK